MVSAYACNPYKGSEEGVGWNWIKAISAYHDISAITAEFHREDIEREVHKHPNAYSGIRFNYVKHKKWHYSPTRFWKFIEGFWFKPIMNRVYREWQKDAFWLGAQLHKKIQFDLVHQLTYVGFRFPGHLWKLDMPFVWGPIGGLENTPWRFLRVLGPSGYVYYAGRNMINSLHKKYLLGPKQAFRKAKNGIIAATEGIQKEIWHWYGTNSHVICEIGPPQDVASVFTLRKPGELLKLSWSGLHLPGKALPLLLQAMAQVPVGLDWQLDILGQGPSTRKWQQETKSLGLHSNCKWHGRMPRDQAVDIVHNSHLFIITSLKDLTSTVLLEALSQGVPVIALDHCGFSDVVTPECGIKVPVDNPDQVIRDIAKSITRLWFNEGLRRNLAKGALRRVQDFSWEKKAEKINEIYERAVAAQKA